MDLKEKTVIVTGAARGIGRAIATAFAQEGANVVLADLGTLGTGAAGAWDYALATDDDLKTAAQAVAKEGVRCEAIAVDVSSQASCRTLIEKTLDAFGRIDVVVNNAGITKAGPIATFSEKDWDRTFAVNAKGIFLVSQAALPALVEAGGGAIINIASMAGKRGYAGLGAYCASKFAVIGFTQALAAEGAASMIRVNAICPGILSTAMWTDHLSKSERIRQSTGLEPGPEAYEAHIKKTIPLGRPQTPQDIAEAAIYLARADSVTGISLTVAGGAEVN